MLSVVAVAGWNVVSVVADHIFGKKEGKEKLGKKEGKEGINMDPQVAAQFFGTIAQVHMTTLAIYIAIITYVLQNNELSKVLLANKLFWFTFITSCFSYTALIIACFVVLLRLGSLVLNSMASWALIAFAGAAAMLLYNFRLVMLARKELLTKRKPRKEKTA